MKNNSHRGGWSDTVNLILSVKFPRPPKQIIKLMEVKNGTNKRNN